ncbi:MAG: cadherin-like beta sandwich domain-containing protein [Prolixibacteraceae bacterium]|jgi:hypothetical protein|nr:cadherin-like beta sandwich domain-containing protein [Prolixibacteraceae bacterium]
MRRTKFYVIIVMMALIGHLQSFAQFVPGEGEIYYLVQKASGFAIAEDSEDAGRAKLYPISGDNTYQRMSIVESHVPGEYFIKNQEMHYFHYFEGWKMGFAADTAETSDDYRFTFPAAEEEEEGYLHLHCVTKPEGQFVGSDGIEVSAGVYPDKTADNPRTPFQILTPDELGFDDPTLASLSNDIGELDPAFNSEVLDYELSVPYGTQFIQLTAKANSPASTVEFFDGLGYEIENGLVSFSNQGVNVEVIVTTADGSTELSYYVAIFVDEGDSDASLSDVELSAGALDPAYDRNVTTYTVVVPTGTSSIEVTGIPNYPEASVTGNGTVTLSNGIGSTTLNVTSFDGSNTASYTINVEAADGKNYAINMAGVDGNDSNIDISGIALNTLPYTVEMWIKPEGAQADNTGLFYGRAGTAGVDEQHAGLEFSSGWQGSGRLRFMTNIAGDYGVVTDVISTDVWHHVAIVLTENYRTLYVDGKEYKEAIANTVYDYSLGKLYLGWDHGGDDRAFKGLIDEVRVWNDSISAETLEAKNFDVLTGEETGLVAYYNFDLTNSSQAVDATPASHHGLITGGTYVESFPRVNLELDTLYIDGVALSPEFNSKTNSYNVLLPMGTTSIDVGAEAVNSNADVTGTGTADVSDGSGTITVTVTSGEYSLDYTIGYTVKPEEIELSLNHSYTFADGTAIDEIAGANGTIIGGSVTEGVYTSLERGDYIELPAEEIAINTYPSITVEAFIMAGNSLNTGENTMLNYFGSTTGDYGTNYYYTAVANADKSRAAISVGSPSSPWSAETGIDGTVLDDGILHHVVSTINYDSITWYIDGMYVGATPLASHNLIAGLDNSLAYLCKSGYTNDPTWLGSILEFNIYSGVMDDQTIAIRSMNFPQETAESDATLSAITFGEDTITGFAPYIFEYDSTLAIGSTSVPEITAIAKTEGATVTVNAASELPGATTITVTSADGEYEHTYTINFDVEEEVVLSDDASLADLMIDGSTVDAFNTETFSYEIELPLGSTDVPEVTATANDENATVNIEAATGLPGTTTITVTAEDGETVATYTIEFSVETSVNAISDQLVKVFPTVTDGAFTVRANSNRYKVTVYSITGEKIFETKAVTTDTRIEVPAKGMYLFAVEMNNNIKVFKVVKTK